MPTKHFASLIRNRFALFGICLFFLPCSLLAQKKASVNSANDPAWQLDASVNGVDFYHAMSDCDGKKVVLLKFDNKNKSSVTVSWKEKFTTQLETKVIGAKGKKEMIIPSGITVPSGCGETNKSRRPAVITGFDVQPHYVAEIRVFEFVDISVQPTN